MNTVKGYRILALVAALAWILTSLGGPVLAATAGTIPSSPLARTAVFTIGRTTYTVDGNTYQMDTAPEIVSGQTLIPLRSLANSLGIGDSAISYQGSGGTAVINLYRTRSDGSQMDVSVYFDQKDPSQDGFAPWGASSGIGVRFSTPPQIAATGRLMVPARDLASALGAVVDWNAVARQVTVTTWETMPSVPGKLSASQVAEQPGGNTITPVDGGTPTTYSYPVEIANPYYPGPGQNQYLYAVIPTLESFGIPAQNILWDPRSKTILIAGNSPFQFIYLTLGTNVNDNLTNEFGVDLDPVALGPSVSLVKNGIIYADDTLDLVLVFGFNLQPTDAQGNNIEPIIQQESVLTV